MKTNRKTQAPGPWVIQVGISDGVVQYIADPRKTFAGEWRCGLGVAIKVFKRLGNAERWLAERPTVSGLIVECPSAAIALARGKS